MVAAAHVHTIKRYGPDRVAGFSPIPAMSMVSHAAGARFVSLIGGAMLSFYDWYADLPVASPQVFGDQTDVPESGDWWDAVLPDPLGLERPGDPHPGRALDDRGALPRPEGRGDEPGLLRRHQVRRRLARTPSRHGRGAGDGDGPRRAEGVLRRPGDPPLRRLRASSTRTCRSSSRCAGTGTRSCPTSSSRPRTWAAHGRGRRVQDRADRRRDRRTDRPQRHAGRPVHRVRHGSLEPRPRQHRPAAHAPRRGRPRSTPQPSTCRASTTPAARAACCAAGYRSARSAGGWSPPSSTCCSPGTASAGRGCPGAGPPRTTTPPSRHTGLAGTVHRRACRGGGEGRAGVRGQRRGVGRPLDDHHGGRDEPLVPLRHDLPHVPRAHHAHRLPGHQRRRVGALRRAGEVSGRSPAGRRWPSRSTGCARRDR